MAFGERVPAQDFPQANLRAANARINPVGIWSDGATMWVADGVGLTLWAFNLTSKARDEEKDISVSADITANRIGGLWGSGNIIHVLRFDAREVKLLAYSTTTQTRVPARDITLDLTGINLPSNPNPGWNFRGVWYNSNRIYAGRFDFGSPVDDRVYVFQTDGTRLDDESFDTPDHLDDGLWSDGAILWCTTGPKIFAYTLSGTRREDLDFDNSTASAGQNTSAYDVWYDGRDLAWIVDIGDDQIYAYGFTPVTGQLVIGTTVAWEDVLTLDAVHRRTEAFISTPFIPTTGTVELINKDGRYDPENIQLNSLLTINDEDNEVIAEGYISDVIPDINWRTNVSKSSIVFRGSLTRLEDADFEVALFNRGFIRTDEIINAILDQAGWPARQRRIDRGQVRLDPAFYSELLASRAIQKAAPLIRAVEKAEVGPVHELRGGDVVFEGRFCRELDDFDPEFTFGEGEGTITPIERIKPNNIWDNIRTVVRYAPERSRLLVERDLWELQDEAVWNGAGIMPINLQTATAQEIKRDNVRQAFQWSPLRAEDYEWTGAGQLVLTGANRDIAHVAIPGPGTLKKLVVRGRGIGRFGDLAFPDLEDDAAIRLYGRRYLDLPVSVIRDSQYEADAFGRINLIRLGHPQYFAKIDYNGEQNAMARKARTGLNISNQVLVQPGYGIPGGAYYCEGWGVQYDAITKFWRCSTYISRRGRRTQTIDDTINITPASNANYTNLRVGFDLANDRSYVVAMECAFPVGTAESDDDDHIVARVTLAGETVVEWSEADIPIGTPAALAVAVNGPGEVIMQIKRGLNATPTATRARIIRIDR